MRRPFVLCVSTLAVTLASPVVAKGVTEADLRGHIAVLASDDFEGRAPGTAGETKTISYIANSWKAAGLKPAAKDGSWYDPVALISRSVGASKFAFSAGTRTLRVASNDIVLIGKAAQYNNKSVPILFGGYGVKADGQAIDNVAGKMVLVFLDPPEFVPNEKQSPRARRDALVAAGAEAVIFVAGLPGSWVAARRQLLSRPVSLESQDKRAALEGAISSEFAVALVTAAGRDWDKLRQAAKADDFAGEPLNVNGSFDVTTNVRRFNSQNVVGKLPGKKTSAGAVMYMGHWDHLGICGDEDSADRICNGAVDNASGIAVLNEVAESLAKKRHDRDIYFVATTGEESGLLGAYAFADSPPLPLDQLLVSFNVDMTAVAPRGAKVVIIGRGTTKLDSAVETVARKAGRGIERSSEANAFLQRQDGWALSQKGVPALMVGGSFADLALIQKFLDSDYHGPDDELTDSTELGGAAEDANLHVALGQHFADSRKFKRIKASE